MIDVAGAIHIHTSYSFDGTTDIVDVIAAARERKLDFIVITDHFRMDARADGWEGWHDGVFVMVGEEISPRYNHCLALGIDSPVVEGRTDPHPQTFIDAVSEQGGIALIAHPDHTGAPKFGVKDYPWKDWTVSGYAGMSIWDLMTDWQEKLSSVPAALAAWAFPALSLSGPKQETLRRWDELNMKGPVFGFGEIDNHNSRKKLLGCTFRIFPFPFAFSTIRTHLLLNSPLSRDTAEAKQQIISAFRGLAGYVAQERWEPAHGFLFRAYDGSAATEGGGEFRIGAGPAKLEVQVPDEGLIRIVKNGDEFARAVSTHMTIDIDGPGLWRTEVHRKKWGTFRPWIFSNPVRVVPAHGMGAVR